MSRSCEECRHSEKGSNEEPCIECSQRYTNKFEPMSNFDYLKSLDSDGLAEFICKHMDVCGLCPGAKYCVHDGGKANGLKKWMKLNMEVSE
jgi:hypothetical protein